MAEIKRLSTELQVKDKLLDTSGDAGTSGQILSSTGTGTNWINAATFSGGTVANASTFSSLATFNNDIIVNGHIYGRAVDGQSSRLYRFGGVYLTWDSDSYGTNDHHSLRSTYGNSFTDSITLNSFNHIRFNIDSNDNNSTSYFEVGDGTTDTSNVIFRIDQAGDVTITGDSTTSGDFTIADNKALMLGTGGDAFFKHTGSAFNFFNDTGHVTFTQRVTDGDIIFKSDNGSGGETEYFKIDGGDEKVIFSKEARFLDSVEARFGTGGDFRLYHSGSTSFIQNFTGHLKLIQYATDGDIAFFSDDGSGGETEYFRLDGGITKTVFIRDTKHEDSVKGLFGTNDDLQIYHDGSNSYIKQQGAATGDLIIEQNVDDKDIIFRSDDGSGGITNYIQIDGSELRTTFNKNIRLNDNVQLQIGSSNDAYITHNGSNTYFVNGVGNLEITNDTNDGDIIFKCDNGSGGVTEYFKIDGSATTTVFSKNVRYQDNVEFRLGSGSDFKAYHSGTNTVLHNLTGNLTILNSADDKDIIFQSDDGSGGTATYFRVDGGAVETRFLKSTLHFDNVKAKFGDGGDLEIYHDGSNSYIKDTGTGNLLINSNGASVQINKGLTENMAEFITDGAVKLYYDSARKFETTSAGATVTGDLSVTGDLNITGDINSVSVTDLDVADKTITVGVGQDSGHSGGSGILISRSDSTNPSLLWNQGTGRFDFNTGLTVTGQVHTTGSVYAKGSLFVQDTDSTSNHIQARSNGTEGFLTVSNGSNWGFIARGPGNDPRIGAWYGGTLKIEGFHSSDGATGSNAIDFAQFQFGNNHFQMNAATSTFAGEITSGRLNITDAGVPIKFTESGNTGTGKYWRQVLDAGDIRFDVDTTSTNGDGSFSSYNALIQLNADGHTDINGALDVAGNIDANGNLDVAGNIVVAGTVDGVDIAARNGVLTSTTTTANAALPKAGGTMTGDLTIDRSGDNISNIHLRRDNNGDGEIVGDIDWLNTTAQGTDDRLAIIRTNTQGGVSGSRGGLLSLYTRAANSSGFNQTTFNQAGNWSFPGDATFAGDVYATDGSASAPAYSFSGRTDTGMYAANHSSNDRIRFSVDGTNRFYIDANGITSANNIYVGTGSTFRNYGGVWKATTGTSGNGFQFYNTADNSSAVLLSITSDASAASASVATFAGNVTVSGTSSSFNTGNNGTFVTNDASNYPRITATNASAQLGLFRAGSNAGGMYIGGAGDGFRLYTAGFSQKLLIDQSGNADFSGNVILNSRLTFDYGGDHYLEAGTNSLAYKDSTGGVVMSLNASTYAATFAGDVLLGDNQKAKFGDNPDLQIYHNGSHSFIQDIGAGDLRLLASSIKLQNTSESNILTLASDLSATFAGDLLVNTTTSGRYIQIDHSDDSLKLADGNRIKIGTGNDLQIYHNGTSNIDNYTGNLDIIQRHNDGDIRFYNDDGSGGTTEYFRVDGGATKTIASKAFQFFDNVKAEFGDSSDLQIYHDSTNSFIVNNTGDLYIRNNFIDRDIIFQSDDGNDGIATYLQIDGSTNKIEMYKYTRFQDTVRFTSNVTFDDNATAIFGDDSNLQIKHTGSESQIFNSTGQLDIRTPSQLLVTSSGGENMIKAINNGAVELYHNNVKKFETTSGGVVISGAAYVNDYLIHSGDTNTKIGFFQNDGIIAYVGGNEVFSATSSGTAISHNGAAKIITQATSVDIYDADLGVPSNKVVKDRNIPCLFNSNFEDAYGTSIVVVPFNNNTENNVSSRTYNHNLTMPYAGKLTKIVMKHVSGTLSSGFTTQLFLYVNGSQQASSSEISLSSSSVTWTPTTNNTFSAGDVLTFAYQKSAIKTFGGVSFGVAIELTDYDI